MRRALRVLAEVGRTSDGTSVADLVDRTGLSRPTVYRLVATLTEEGFLRAGRDRNDLLLGPMFLELARTSWVSFDLRGAAAAELVRLAKESGETVRLLVLSGDRLVCIETEGAVSDGAGGVGAVEDLHTSAAGLALAAFADPDVVDIRPSSARDLHLTRARFYAVRTNGAGEWPSVAAPVFDETGRAVAAICVSGPPARFTEDTMHAIAPAVIEAARQTSRAAGGYPFPLTPANAPAGRRSPGIQCLVRSRDLNGDSPVILGAGGGVCWIDVLGPTFNRLDGRDGKVVSAAMPDVVGALVQRRNGSLIAGFANAIGTIDPGTGRVTSRHVVPAIAPGSRINDGGEDGSGRLWLGVIDVGQSVGNGRLLQVGENGISVAEIGGLWLPNGIAWSDDWSTLYVVDSARRCVRAYSYDLASGTAGEGRTILDFDESGGRPAGLAVDHKGRLWTAIWDGWRLVCFDTEGRVVEEVVVPVPRPSDIAIDTAAETGGPARLVFTSARVRLTAAQLSRAPLSGGLFACPLPE